MAITHLIAVVLWLASAAFVAPSASLPVEKTSVYVWSNTGVLGDGSALQAHYQTLKTKAILNELLSSDTDKYHQGKLFSSAEPSVPEGFLTVIYINRKPEVMSSKALEGSLTMAKSSIFFPNAEGAPGEQLVEDINQVLGDGEGVKVVGCNDAAAGLMDADMASSKVAVVCSSKSDVDDLHLGVLQKALDSSGRSYVALYAALPNVAVDSAPAATRRSLLSVTGFGPYTTCDAACQTQVRWLEGILAGLLLALASMSGLCCLYLLDTPTKFEAPKDSSQ